MAYPPQPQPQQPGPWGGAPGQGAPQGYGPQQSPSGPQQPTQQLHSPYGPATQPAYEGSPYGQGGPAYGPPPAYPSGSGTGNKIAAVVFTLMGLTVAGIIGILVYLFTSMDDKIDEIALPVSTPSARTPQPSQTPSPSTTVPEPGSPITADEFGDWNFMMGTAKFRADKVAGWTYDSCTPVDGKERVLRANRCERAVQLAYSAYKGHLKAVTLLMQFPTDQAAKTTADRLAKLSSNAIRWRHDKAHSEYVYGKILSGASKKYVVVTIVTADRTAEKKARSFHGYLQADHEAAFLFRD
ncbi:hypothetical protein ACFMQL_20010 [Nonomuraea fastidiosa]|jgi:hypothetical protein|uniref:hypothetical protein n=1 Tax=Nonomuraea TaxID=83681 RepID=UPI003252DB2E